MMDYKTGVSERKITLRDNYLKLGFVLSCSFWVKILASFYMLVDFHSCYEPTWVSNLQVMLGCFLCSWRPHLCLLCTAVHQEPFFVVNLNLCSEVCFVFSISRISKNAFLF